MDLDLFLINVQISYWLLRNFLNFKVINIHEYLKRNELYILYYL